MTFRIQNVWKPMEPQMSAENPEFHLAFFCLATGTLHFHHRVHSRKAGRPKICRKAVEPELGTRKGDLTAGKRTEQGKEHQVGRAGHETEGYGTVSVGQKTEKARPEGEKSPKKGPGLRKKGRGERSGGARVGRRGGGNGPEAKEK